MSTSARFVPVDKKLPWLEASWLIAAQVPYVQHLCLRDDNGRRLNHTSSNPLYGMCYTSSEALFHLSEDPLVPHWVRYGPEKHQTHWYLLDPSDNRVIDITSSQFSDWDLYSLYDYGRPRPFGTPYPSKRAQMLLDRVVPSIGCDMYSSRFYDSGLAGSHEEFLRARQRKAENSNPTRS